MVLVSNYELNLELQLSKTSAESNFETASCYFVLQVELLNCMFLKPLRVTENQILQQLSNINSKIFHSQIFFQL